MNRFDNSFDQRKQAKIAYSDGQFRITSPGDFVVCAVTAKPIPLDELKYWSVDLQEAYADSAAAFRRYQEVNG